MNKNLNKYYYPAFKKGTDYIKENLDFRKKLEAEAYDDIDLQALTLSMCNDDVLFFFNVFAWTFNPRLDMPHLPFITYPFQDETIVEIVNCIEEGMDVFIEKSRDMGISWIVLTIFVWGWLFRGWDLRAASRIRDYVDKGGDMNSLFEKMRYIIDRLPNWMLPHGFENKRGTKFNSFCRLVNPVHNNTIVGESTNPNFARGGRSRAILYDEFAFWKCAEEAWTGGADTTNCRIIVSTPNGKGNKFADIKFNDELKIKRIRLHWKLHPLKDDKWYEEECSRRTEQEIAAELDISYEASAANRVYESFNNVPIGSNPEFDYDPTLPLYVGWDFGHAGKDPTAIIWAQLNPKNLELKVIDSYSKSNMDINYFGTLISGEMDSQFQYDYEAMDLINRHQGWKDGIHVGDPYDGNQTTFVRNTTIKKELQKHGVYLNLDRGSNNPLERIRIVTMFMNNMRVHERCDGFIDSMQNSRWPKRNRLSESTSPVTKPVHNEYSHFRTALEYLCEYLDGYRGKKKTGGRFYNTTKNTGYKDIYKNILR